jgi:competence protein ComEA
MQDRRVQLTIGIIALLVLLGGGVGLMAAHRPPPPPIVITPPSSAAVPTASPSPAPTATVPTPPPVPTPAPETRYYVHVAGAVRNPSLYLLPPGSRVMQAIKAAGGPTSKADLDAVNLAEKVKDGEKIYIPNKAPVTQTAMVVPPGNSLGHESSETAPTPTAAVPISTTPAKITKSAKGSTSKSNKLTSPSQGQININTAGTDQLERLPGVGPAMAGRILAYRQQAGGFQKIEELQEISGIGPKKYAKIAPLIKLQ